MDIKFNNVEPIYIQIINHYKVIIASGELRGGDKLPSVRELSLQLKVNPNTIQKAFNELEREELVYTLRGTGKFVVEDEKTIKNLKITMADHVIEDFVNSMKTLGFNNDEIMKALKINMDGGSR